MIYSSNITIPTLCPINFSNDKEAKFYPQQANFIGKLPPSLHIQFLCSDMLVHNVSILFKYLGRYTVKTVNVGMSTNGDFRIANAVIDTKTLRADFIGTIQIWHDSNLLAESTPYERKVDTKYWKLITYTNSKNYWNTVFDTPFSVYVPCGFNPTDDNASLEVENFQDQNLQSIPLYAEPYNTETLTIGATSGIPSWFFIKLNAIFACDTITIDGVPYKRYKDAVLEKAGVTYDGLHMLRIELQPENNNNNQLTMIETTRFYQGETIPIVLLGDSENSLDLATFTFTLVDSFGLEYVITKAMFKKEEPERYSYAFESSVTATMRAGFYDVKFKYDETDVRIAEIENYFELLEY